MRGEKVPFSTASASLIGEHMEEDEKKSDEIEINVGGDRGQGKRRKKRRDRIELDTKDIYFICLICKPISKIEEGLSM